MPSTEFYTLSLHDALPILLPAAGWQEFLATSGPGGDFGFLTEQLVELVVVEESIMYPGGADPAENHYAADRATLRQVLTNGLEDRKSTRLNSSHSQISYAVHRVLHSFPTRRSSDLAARRRLAGVPRDLRPRWRLRLPHRTARRARGRRGVDHVPGRCRSGREPLRRRSRDPAPGADERPRRSEEHTSELQSQSNLVCRPPSSTLFPYTTLFRSCCPPQAGRSSSRPQAQVATSASSPNSSSSSWSSRSRSCTRAVPIRPRTTTPPIARPCARC